jgi:hypothetical protein
VTGIAGPSRIAGDGSTTPTTVVLAPTRFLRARRIRGDLFAVVLARTLRPVVELYHRVRDVYHVKLVGQGLDDRREVIEVAPDNSVARGRPGKVQAARPKVRHGRQPGDVDSLPFRALDGLKLSTFARTASVVALPSRPAPPTRRIDLTVVFNYRRSGDPNRARGSRGSIRQIDVEVDRLAVKRDLQRPWCVITGALLRPGATEVMGRSRFR